MKTIKWINNVIEKKKWLILVICLIQSLSAVMSILFALVMKNAIDHAVNQKQNAFYQAIIMLILIILFQIILKTAYRYFYEYTSICLENNFKQHMLKSIFDSNYQKINHYHSGEIMNHLTSDIRIICDTIISTIPQSISMFIKVIGVLYVMYTIEPFFTYFFIIGGVFVSIFSFIPRKRLKNLHRDVQHEEGKMRSFMQECIENLTIIQSFDCEDKMMQMNEKNMMFVKNQRMKRNNYSNFYNVFLSLGIQTGYLVGFIWSGYHILTGTISYGTLTAMIQLIGQIQSPFVNAGNNFFKWVAMVSSSERLIEIDKMVDKNKAIKYKGQDVYENMDDLCFEHVYFSYDEQKPVLVDENFKIHKGEFVALVGKSGAGKSTIMKLLLSLYQVEKGKIYFQCNDQRIYLEDVDKGMFAYVPQGNALMSGTIEEIVSLSSKDEKIDLEKVKEACRYACADEFIKELPSGYQTFLGEKGSGLSEGQMQRLAIARAIYSDCPILLLDEITSALDLKTEKKLIESLRKIENRTIILITHRQEALDLCHRVITRKEYEDHGN